MLKSFYISMYTNHTKKLAKLQKFGLIRKGFDISTSKLTALEQLAILNLLKQELRVGNDGEDSSYSLVSFLDLYFDNDTAMLASLEKLKANVSPVLAQKIDSLITEITKYKERIKIINAGSEVAGQSRIEHSLEFPLVHDKPNAVINKFYKNRQYAFDRINTPNKLPTTPVSIDASEFSSLTRNDLVSMYRAENFYLLSKNQKLALMQATVNEYCKSLGVEPCAIAIENLGRNGNKITFGEYKSSLGLISINSELFDRLEYGTQRQNQFMPFKLLSVLIHESRHRWQHKMIDGYNLTPKEELIKAAFKESPALSYNDYLSSADELDARDAALNYMRDVIMHSRDYQTTNKLASYYNDSKKQEMSNLKTQVSRDVANLFPDIYDQSLILNNDVIVNTPIGKREFYTILNTNYTEPESN